MSLKQFIRRQIMGSSTFRRIEVIEQRLDEIPVKERNFAPYCYLGQGVGLIRLYDGHVLYVEANETPVVGSLIKTGRWFPHVENLLRHLVRPDQTVINAGAHVGYFSVLLADMVGPVGRLLAIEPQLHLADLIDRSLYLSGYRERSEVICCALGPQEGSVDIAVREAYSSGGTVVAKLDMLGTEWVTRPVRQRRLDDIVKERGMKPG
jgi:FkbM family methyltransferase